MRGVAAISGETLGKCVPCIGRNSKLLRNAGSFQREVERERLPHNQLNTGHLGLSKAGKFGENRVLRRFQRNDEVVTLVGRDDLPLFTCPIVPYSDFDAWDYGASLVLYRSGDPPLINLR